MPRRFLLPIVLVFVLMLAGAVWLLAERLEDTDYVPLDHPAINADGPSKAPLHDPVSQLEEKLEKGSLKLDYASNGLGYLPALLKLLNVNIDSQALVFSRTSIQANRISPRTPRAIYFNDQVSVGYVQNGEVLEFTSLDPRQGVQMYVMDAARSAHPEFAPRSDCLQCHQGGITLGVPGMVISSVHPASDLTRDMHGSAFITDQSTPFKDLWGGWYVTGTGGAQAHLGNNTELVDPVHPGNLSHEGTQNITSLTDKFDTSKYLAPTSDIVALMTLEHQVRMTNLLVRIGWDTRIAVYDKKMSGEVQDRIFSEIDELVAYMLFADESPLKEPVAGVSTFTKSFPQRGPRDSKGRSLRDFDLKTRLFRYPLSYMIYSPTFDALPDAAKDRIYQRLFDVLTGKDQSKTFAGLAADTRANIVEILRETKKLPDYWAANTRQ